jgi:hypothetical protein
MWGQPPRLSSERSEPQGIASKSLGMLARTAQPALGSLARMVVEVKQQRMSHKAHDKPGRRFQYSLESWGHEASIPHRARLSEVHSRCAKSVLRRDSLQA